MMANMQPFFMVSLGNYEDTLSVVIGGGERAESSLKF